MTRPSARRRGLYKRWCLWAIVALTPVLATIAAARHRGGDFYATLPGGYAQALNPILWDSPDLAESWAFHKNSYLHGPIQYLTLYPIVFLDSYRQIALALLPIYAIAIAVTFALLLRTVRLLTGESRAALPVAASTMLFFPLLQAYVQREFEVIVLTALAGALWWLIRDEKNRAAALLAYVAWFKYLPLMFAGYLALRRWVRPLLTFVALSVVVLVLSELLFGLANFFNNNVPATAAQTLTFTRAGFCAHWSPFNQTLSNVRHGLCRVEHWTGWPLARDLYVGICAAIAAAYLLIHRRLSRATLDAGRERWRRAFELSIITTIYACFFFGHYYYLSALTVPLAVLLARRLSNRSGLYPWAIAYILLSASLGPAWISARALGFSGWHLYMEGATYLFGELWLIAVLLREYANLDRHYSATTTEGASPAVRL